MERLTEKHVKKNGGYYMKCSEYCEREETMCLECERSDEIVDRLGSIEDILGDDYDLDRLRELVEADREGRCVPVVRCRECRHYKERRTQKYGNLICRCTRMGKYDMDYPVKPDDFCSYGERTTD